MAGDAYEATLALVMARAAQDEAVLLRGLTHPSRLVRIRAASFAGPAIRDDAALERVLPELSPQIRRRVLKGVALAGRTGLAARLLPYVREHHGDFEAALLLPAIDAQGVRRLLPELAHAVQAWPTMVRLHTDEVTAFIQARFAETPRAERGTLFSTWRVPLRKLLILRSEAVLTLVREYVPSWLPRLVMKGLPGLMRKHPEQVLQLLIHPAFRKDEHGYVLRRSALRDALRALSLPQRLTLARALRDDPNLLVWLLRWAPPSERAALYTHAFQDTLPRDPSDELLSVLPDTLRDAEVVRLLGLPEAQERPEWRSRLLSFRTIEHAREPLLEQAASPRAKDRASALGHLVRSTALSRRGLTRTLSDLSRLENEQEPVRRHVLGELARVPGSLFTPEHIPLLDSLVTHTLEARDTSSAILKLLLTLAHSLIRAHFMDHRGALIQFALTILERLPSRTDGIDLCPSVQPPRGGEHHLFAALLPRLRALGQEQRYELLYSMCEVLRQRTGNMDMLQAMLESITESGSGWDTYRASQLWLRPSRLRDQRVRKMLARDASAIQLPRVLEHLHRHRQEWLDSYLDGGPLGGRFGTDGKGWMPHLEHGFHRLLPRQQARYRDYLLRVVRGEVDIDWKRTPVLRILSCLPVVTPRDLQPFLEERDVPTVEATLGALARLDQPAASLPLLLEHLDGERAPVAMSAASQVLRQLPVATRFSTLSELLARDRLKVTVRKEVVRLLATLPGARALALLRQQWDCPQLHRDVRIAVGHSARQLLATEESSWEIVEAMARSPDVFVAESLLDQLPASLPPRLRPRYATLLLQLAEHPAPAVQQRIFEILDAWTVGSEERIARAAAARIQDLSRRIGWEQAVTALVKVTRDGRGFEHVVACASALVSAPVLEEQEAGPERDLPALQRLRKLIEALLLLPRPELLSLRPRLAEVAHALAPDPSLWPLSARLRVLPLAWKDSSATAEVLSKLALEARDEPHFLAALEAAVSASLKLPGMECPAELLLDVAVRLESEAPLVAVELVREAGGRMQWKGEVLRHLRALRRHPRPSVRLAARSVTIVTE